MAIKIQALSDLCIWVSQFMEPVNSSAFWYCCIVACETQCGTYNFVDMPTKLTRGDFSKTLRCQIFLNAKKDGLVVKESVLSMGLLFLIGRQPTMPDKVSLICTNLVSMILIFSHGPLALWWQDLHSGMAFCTMGCCDSDPEVSCTARQQQVAWKPWRHVGYVFFSPPWG